MKKIKLIYSNLRIKYKMFLLISIVLLGFSIGGFSVLQYAFRVYNGEIYRQSALALSISSMSIENELKKMERLSYQISTDQLIQNYLIKLKESDNEFDKFSIGTDLKKRVLLLGALNKYVKSIQIYDYEDLEYKVGNQVMTISQSWLEKIKEEASEKKGGVQWIYSKDEDNSLIVTRDIRYYIKPSFEHLGVFVVRMDIDKIISDITGNLGNDQMNFLILNENNELIYSTDDQIPFQHITTEISFNKGYLNQGYHILDIEYNPYFVTYIPSQHMDWSYVIISPYSAIFKAIVTTGKAVVVIYIILFLIALYMAIRFVSNMTKPIESLNRKMKRVQTGELDLFERDSEVSFSKDELGEMHYNFQLMMDQINTLIKENYKKQIAIKDAEYKALQAQINPHFLYNTLESINWTAKVNGQNTISDIVESLGFLLRKSIETKEPLITIKEELNIVKRYITIQRHRFEEKLDFHMDISPEIMNCKIPKFVLQPIIENSIQYGLQQRIGTCKINISGEKIHEKVILTVKDNGIGMDEELLKQIRETTYESKGTGLGLKNIRERIVLLFGESYGMEIKSQKNHGTTVRIIIPYTVNHQDILYK